VTADSDGTKVYKGFGFEFLYPADWMIEEDIDADGELTVSLETPEAAFLIISRFGSATDPAELIQRAAEVIEEEYSDVECEDLDIEIGTEDSFGMKMFFYCVDMVVAAKLLAFTHRDNTFLIQYQAVDSDFDEIEGTFRVLVFQLLERIGCVAKLEDL
jgi:hypothetical protein